MCYDGSHPASANSMIGFLKMWLDNVFEVASLALSELVRGGVITIGFRFCPKWKSGKKLLQLAIVDVESWSSVSSDWVSPSFCSHSDLFSEDNRFGIIPHGTKTGHLQYDSSVLIDFWTARGIAHSCTKYFLSTDMIWSDRQIYNTVCGREPDWRLERSHISKNNLHNFNI